MPLFDFKCLACDKEFEILLMGRDKPYCPQCGSDDLQKQMSAFSTRTEGKNSGSGGSKCSGCAGGNCSSC